MDRLSKGDQNSLGPRTILASQMQYNYIDKDI